MIYEILNQDGEVINRIVADRKFVEEFYAGRYRLEEVPDLETGEEFDIESEVEPDEPEATEEQ